MSDKVDNKLFEKESVEEMIFRSREDWENSWRQYFASVEAKAEEILDLDEFIRPETD